MLLLQWLLALVSPSCEASKKFTLESPKASEVDLHAYYLHPNGNYMYLMPMSLHRDYDLLKEPKGLEGRMAILKKSDLDCFEKGKSRLQRTIKKDDSSLLAHHDFYTIDEVVGTLIEGGENEIVAMFRSDSGKKKNPNFKLVTRPLSLIQKPVGEAEWQLSLARENAPMLPIKTIHYSELDGRLLHRFKLFDRINGRFWLTRPSFTPPKPYSCPMLYVKTQKPTELISFVEMIFLYYHFKNDAIGVNHVTAIEFSLEQKNGGYATLLYFDPAASVAQVKGIVNRLSAYRRVLTNLPRETSMDNMPYSLYIDGKLVQDDFSLVTGPHRLATNALITSAQLIELSRPIPNSTTPTKQKGKKATKAHVEPIPLPLMEIEPRNEKGLIMLVFSFWTLICVKTAFWTSLMAFKISRKREGFYLLSMTVRESEETINWPGLLENLLDYCDIPKPASNLDHVVEDAFEQAVFHPQGLAFGWCFGEAEMTGAMGSLPSLRPELALINPKQFDDLPLIPAKAALFRFGGVKEELFSMYSEILTFSNVPNIRSLWSHLAQAVLSPLCPLDLVSIILRYDPVRMYCVVWLFFGILRDPRRDAFLLGIQSRYAGRRETLREDFVCLMPTRFASPSPYHLYLQKGSNLIPLGQGDLKPEMITAPILLHYGPISTESVTARFSAPLDTTYDPLNLKTPGRAIRFSKLEGVERREMLFFDRTALALEPFAQVVVCSEVLHPRLPSAPWFFFKREGEDSKMRLEGVDLDAADILASSAKEWLILRGEQSMHLPNLVQMVFTRDARSVAQVLNLIDTVNIVGARLWKLSQGTSFVLISEPSQKDSILAAMNVASTNSVAFDSASFVLTLPSAPEPLQSLPSQSVTFDCAWTLHMSPSYEESSLTNPVWILENLGLDYLKSEHPPLFIFIPSPTIQPNYRVTFEVEQISEFYTFFIHKLASKTLPPQLVSVGRKNRLSFDGVLEVVFNMKGSSLIDAFAQSDEWLKVGRRVSVETLALNFKLEGDLASLSDSRANYGKSIKLHHEHFAGSFSPMGFLGLGLPLLQNMEALDGLSVNLYSKPINFAKVASGEIMSLLHLKATLTSETVLWNQLLQGIALNHAETVEDWSKSSNSRGSFRDRLLKMDVEINPGGNGLVVDLIASMKDEGLEPNQSALKNFIWRCLLMQKMPALDIFDTSYRIRAASKGKPLEGKHWNDFMKSLDLLPIDGVTDWNIEREDPVIGEEGGVYNIKIMSPALSVPQSDGVKHFLRYAYRLLFSRMKAINSVKLSLTGNAEKPLELAIRVILPNDYLVPSYQDYLATFMQLLTEAPWDHLDDWFNASEISHTFTWFVDGKKIQSEQPTVVVDESPVTPAPTEEDKPLQPPATPAVPQPVKLHREWILSSSAGEASIKTTFDFESAWPVHLSPVWMKLSLAPQYLVSKWREIKLEFVGDEAPFEAAVTLMRHVLECKDIYRRSIVAVTLTAEGESACEEQLSEAEAFLEYYGFSKEEDVEDWESHPASELSDLQWARLNGFGITLPLTPSASYVVAETSNSSDVLSNGVHFNWADEGEDDSNLIVEQMQHLCIDDKFEVEEEEEKEEDEKHWILAVRVYEDVNEAKLTRLFEMLPQVAPGKWQ